MDTATDFTLQSLFTLSNCKIAIDLIKFYKIAEHLHACEMSSFSAETGLVSHYLDYEKGAQLLCDFASRRASGRENLPKDTKDALQQRVDPNLWETERQAVESLLYTPGSMTYFSRTFSYLLSD